MRAGDDAEKAVSVQFVAGIGKVWFGRPSPKSKLALTQGVGVEEDVARHSLLLSSNLSKPFTTSSNRSRL